MLSLLALTFCAGSLNAGWFRDRENCCKKEKCCKNKFCNKEKNGLGGGYFNVKGFTESEDRDED